MQRIKLFLCGTESRNEAEDDLLEVTARLILDQILLDVELHLLILGAEFRDFTDPWVFKELRYRRSLMLVPFKTLEDKVLCITCDILPLGLGELDVLLADILIDFLNISSVEWCKAREKLVSDDAETPHVDLLVVFFMFHQLGSHIKWRTKHEIQAGLLIEFLCEPKICNFDVEIILVLRN